MSLKNKTIIITGASRGIGRSIALKSAKEGANVVLAAKSIEEGKLPGTIHSVAKEVEELGGKALPIQVDVRHEEQVSNMVDKAVAEFGQINALINNAGAINLTPLSTTPPKRMDLMLEINLRAVLLCSHFCIPKLKEAGGGHIINMSPPISLDPKWYGNHVTYTISKFGMSMATIGLAQELKEDKISVNSLWPKTIIATAAIKWLMGDDGMKNSRTPEIMADAAHQILTSDAEFTGNTLIDETLLKDRGVTDFKIYQNDKDAIMNMDLFVEAG
ncbi:short chain dehydrogenase [bacterium K02(2017)]|nr:short chain dehydrogenase [bacterium K02(2017)]